MRLQRTLKVDPFLAGSASVDEFVAGFIVLRFNNSPDEAQSFGDQVLDFPSCDWISNKIDPATTLLHILLDNLVES